jgi:hypothetical protein
MKEGEPEETEMDPISKSVLGSTKSVLHIPQPDGSVKVTI